MKHGDYVRYNKNAIGVVSEFVTVGRNSASTVVSVNFGNGKKRIWSEYLELVTDPVEIAAAKLLQGI